MANYGPTSVPFFLVGGRDLLASIVFDFEDGIEADTEESHGLGGTGWKEHKATGIRKAMLSQRGFFDDAVDGVNAALNGAQMTAQVITYGVSGGAIGAKLIGLSGAFASTYVRALSRTGIHKANATYTVTGVKEEGRLLHGKTAEAGATWNTDATPADDGVSSSNAGGSAYLQVPALTLGGYTSATVKIRHSSDNVTFVDLGTFAVVTAKPTAQRITVPGTVFRYLSSSGAWNGAGAGQSITPVVGFARG
ncbi:MAG TPA: hypothetical protein VNJ04_13845 [Gemmatimonadaceae bacterium]|nr:hypothetical protein [Gemmatimonadaceae bacterium]